MRIRYALSRITFFEIASTLGEGCYFFISSFINFAITFDPSYTGESGGQPRYMASPDINTEDFMAAVDFLSVQNNVDAEKIGIIGIYSWGGMALNVAILKGKWSRLVCHGKKRSISN